MRKLILFLAFGAMTAAAPAQGMIVLAQSFDDITSMPGWVMRNHSSHPYLTDWFQGNDGVFPAQSGASDSYIGANFNNTSSGTISNWLITPQVSFENGQILSFFTRGPVGSQYPDRLQVRMSTSGSSTYIGSTANSVGNFTNLMLDINPTLGVGGFPEGWTQYDMAISGLSGPTSGRLAFRYYVTNAGPYAPNSNYIGIDSFSLQNGAQVPPVPEPATLLLVGIGAAGIFARRLRKRA